MSSELLGLMAQRPGCWISGEELASSLGISRAGVWKQVQRLREKGYMIDALPNRGYLLKDCDVLDLSMISPRTMIVGKSVIFRREVGSTNALARQIAESAQDGTIVLSEVQTEGKGRLSRSWSSPSGGVWMSIILKPQIPLALAPRINMGAAVAVVRAVEGLYGLKLRIKWPNDLMACAGEDLQRAPDGQSSPAHSKSFKLPYPLLTPGSQDLSCNRDTAYPADPNCRTDRAAASGAGAVAGAPGGMECQECRKEGARFDALDRKVCGILSEIEAEPDRLKHAIVGIGLNANLCTEQLKTEWNATSLCREIGRMVDRSALIERIAEELETVYLQIVGDYGWVYESWQASSCTLGKRVRVTLARPAAAEKEGLKMPPDMEPDACREASSEELLGVASRLDADGALFVRTDEGKDVRVIAGDCIHLRSR
jgi:BirA family biotin operon repressor/biotin-[acetyl-CoA-carboxylase] ligase